MAEVIKFRSNKNRTLFINQPLENKENDQIGISVYVEKIQQAIIDGAEIIAIASDFGTGKSSLISLLEKEYGVHVEEEKEPVILGIDRIDEYLKFLIHYLQNYSFL